MPFPLIGAIAGSVARVGGRLLGKALRHATKGKLLGKGGGRELIKTTIRGAVATTAGAILTKRVGERFAPSLPQLPGMTVGGGGGRYTKDGRLIRRMNPLNVRALRRSIRRVGSAQKLLKSIFTISGGHVHPRGVQKHFPPRAKLLKGS